VTPAGSGVFPAFSRLSRRLACRDGHKLPLLDRLLENSGDASVGFDVGGRILTGMMIMVDPEGRSFFGWSVPEIEVLVPDSWPSNRDHRSVRVVS
jgi:hypothetical protein